MSDLIHIGNGGNTPATMSSREIAELCETRHNQVVETIERLFEKGVLRESRKTTRTFRPDGGGRPTEVYDLTKRDTLVVASGYNDELRARIIDRWQELEAGQSINPALLSRMQLIQLAYEAEKEAQAERSARLEVEGKFNRIAKADGSLCITDAAKALQVRPKDLFGRLQAEHWIYRRTGGKGYLGYQAKVQSGFVEHKVDTVVRPDGTEAIREQVRITPKGLAKLAGDLGATA